MNSTVGIYAKAIIATLLAFLGALAKVLPGGITGQEWIEVIVGTLVIGGGVWVVPNKRAGSTTSA